MSTVIDFATRQPLNSNSQPAELDWTFDHAPHPECSNMVLVTMVVERSAVSELENAHFQAWGAHNRRAMAVDRTKQAC